MDLRRFLARYWTVVERRCRKPLSIASLVGIALTVGAFVVVAVAPLMRTAQYSWSSWGSWKDCFGLAWPAILAATYLKFSEKFKRKNLFSRADRRKLNFAKQTTARALMELMLNSETLRSDPADEAGKPVYITQVTENMRHVRESVLECIAHEVHCLLDLPEDEPVVASLLDFSHGETSSMVVVARSTKERSVGLEYPSDQLAGWQAIRNQDVVVVDDVREDPRWQGLPKKRYRSVTGIPVVKDEQAFGALSIDAEAPYQFVGRREAIALHCTPYIAMLALTYPTCSLQYPCRYDTTHLTP